MTLTGRSDFVCDTVQRGRLLQKNWCCWMHGSYRTVWMRSPAQRESIGEILQEYFEAFTGAEVVLPLSFGHHWLPY